MGEYGSEELEDTHLEKSGWNTSLLRVLPSGWSKPSIQIMIIPTVDGPAKSCTTDLGWLKPY